MKNKILFYFAFLIGVISLQSCVSNYVVSNPIVYKSNAKIVSIDSRHLEKVQKELIKKTIPSASIVTLQDEEKAKALAAEIKRKNTIDNILEEARTYMGTPYRYGGTTRSGIDCSALVLSAFESGAGVDLPRVAAAQARQGNPISQDEIRRGDLLFFAQRGGRGRISHVGIVEEVTENGEIKFIHAATSRGVMISSLHDTYWGPKFAYAKRIIDTNEIEPILN